MTRKTTEELKLEVQRANDAYLLTLPQFQSFLLRYLITRRTFDPNQRVDPISSAFAEGQRASGLEVMRVLAAADGPLLSQILLCMIAPETSQPNETPDDRTDEPFER